MDDEIFKRELLSRLDLIIELLQSSLPEACIEEAAGKNEAGDSTLYTLNDELQDAIQRWKQENGR